MGVWVYILIAFSVLILAFVLIIVLPTRLRIRCTFKKGRLDYSVSVRIPLMPWYIRVPDIGDRPKPPGGGLRARDRLPGDDRPQEDGGEKPGVRALLDSIRAGYDMFQSVRPQIAAAVSRVLSAIVIRNFELCVLAGTGDAAETALVCGGLQSALGVALAFLCRKGLKFESRPRVAVRPRFNETLLDLELRAEVSARSFPIILASLAIYRRFQKSNLTSRRPVSRAGRVEY